MNFKKLLILIAALTLGLNGFSQKKKFKIKITNHLKSITYNLFCAVKTTQISSVKNVFILFDWQIGTSKKDLLANEVVMSR